MSDSEFIQSVAIVDPKTGMPTTTFLQKINSVMRTLTGTKSGLTSSKAGLEQTASGHWLLEAPEDKTYAVIQKASQAFTITEVTTRCTAGTATVTITINGTNLGGTANSASTTEQSQAHSSANAVAAGDTVAIVVSSTSSAEMLTVDIAGTVTLDP
ncbi:conserved protein of unknown function [Hyphomicrobium sp. 1Nfss2.1]|uniref:hypothetical protein n=1 Tax=Hyphomicrobium sp. 1Nfss2.1 TaxID=3413936 RepID=UPI003C7CDD20